MKKLFILLVAVAALGLTMCNEPVQQENVEVDSIIVQTDSIVDSIS